MGKNKKSKKKKQKAVLQQPVHIAGAPALFAAPTSWSDSGDDDDAEQPAKKECMPHKPLVPASKSQSPLPLPPQEQRKRARSQAAPQHKNNKHKKRKPAAALAPTPALAAAFPSRPATVAEASPAEMELAAEVDDSIPSIDLEEDSSHESDDNLLEDHDPSMLPRAYFQNARDLLAQGDECDEASNARAERALRMCIRAQMQSLEQPPESAGDAAEGWDDSIMLALAHFLLHAAYVELGKLRLDRGDDEAAQHALGAALVLGPLGIEGRFHYAQSIRREADTAERLEAVETELRRCSELANKVNTLGQGDENAALEDWLNNPYLDIERELESGAEAERSLAMLLCQRGHDEQAAPLLRELGYTHRLTRQVLNHEQPSGEPKPLLPSDSSKPYLRVMDGALSVGDLAHMQRAFAPNSPFWKEHR